MPNYLTKEEIRQWRGSLEKITLEEFAARLGKEVEESKPTNDVVDIVKTRGTSSNTDINVKVNEGFSRIAERAFVRERQISHTPFSINRKQYSKSENNIENDNIEKTSTKLDVKKTSAKQVVVQNTKEISEENNNSLATKDSTKKELQIVLKKALTDREQLVFDYMLNNIGKTVFAKDLASLLDLPRDYVYKYIKNLRAKIDGDKLKNVPSGGFVLCE